MVLQYDENRARLVLLHGLDITQYFELIIYTSYHDVEIAGDHKAKERQRNYMTTTQDTKPDDLFVLNFEYGRSL